MSVDETEIRKIARLARIAITSEECENLKGELNRILDWIGQLDEVDTSDVAPMTGVVAQKMRERSDEVSDGGIADDILKNAPDARDQYFLVPKVVE